jgi:hypothetical protein
MFNWQVILGFTLIGLSVLVYYAHFVIFKDAHHIFIYLIGDIAFVFLEVLFVTLILHRLLTFREKQALMKKMNMVIGAFFSEVGRPLVEFFINFDADSVRIAKKLIISKDWDKKHFQNMKKAAISYQSHIDIKKGDLEGLKEFLIEKRPFLLRLLENPNLLEHESFTNLLWAVFHLTEELARRKSLFNLPESDYEHVANDIKRAYGQIIKEWLDYMNHLKSDYPYLFSLAIRTIPFDPDASLEVLQ